MCGFQHKVLSKVRPRNLVQYTLSIWLVLWLIFMLIGWLVFDIRQQEGGCVIATLLISANIYRLNSPNN